MTNLFSFFNHMPRRGKVVSVLGLLFILLAIFITVYAVRQRQNYQSKAAGAKMYLCNLISHACEPTDVPATWTLSDCRQGIVNTGQQDKYECYDSEATCLAACGGTSTSTPTPTSASGSQTCSGCSANYKYCHYTYQSTTNCTNYQDAVYTPDCSCTTGTQPCPVDTTSCLLTPTPTPSTQPSADIVCPGGMKFYDPLWGALPGKLDLNSWNYATILAAVTVINTSTRIEDARFRATWTRTYQLGACWTWTGTGCPAQSGSVLFAQDSYGRSSNEYVTGFTPGSDSERWDLQAEFLVGGVWQAPPSCAGSIEVVWSPQSGTTSTPGSSPTPATEGSPTPTPGYTELCYPITSNNPPTGALTCLEMTGSAANCIAVTVASNCTGTRIYQCGANASGYYAICKVLIPPPSGSPSPTPSLPPAPSCSMGDLNGDGCINAVDLGILIDNYNPIAPRCTGK